MSGELSTNIGALSTDVIDIHDANESDPLRGNHVARGIAPLYDLTKHIQGLVVEHLGDLISIDGTPVFKQLGGNMEVYPRMSDNQDIERQLTHYQYTAVGFDTGEFKPELLKKQLGALVEWMREHPFEPRPQINLLTDRPFAKNPVPLLKRLEDAIQKAEVLGLFSPQLHAGRPSLEKDTVDIDARVVEAPAPQITGPAAKVAITSDYPPPTHSR